MSDLSPLCEPRRALACAMARVASRYRRTALAFVWLPIIFQLAHTEPRRRARPKEVRFWDGDRVTPASRAEDAASQAELVYALVNHIPRAAQE